MSAAEMDIRLNSGEIVRRPYREAVRLLSRRQADPVSPEEVSGSHGTVSSVSSDTTDGPEAPSAPSGPVVALDDLSKPELVEMAREQGLTVSGTKDDLIARLSVPASEAGGANAEDEPLSEPDSDAD